MDSLLRELFEPIYLQPFAQASFVWMQNPDKMLQNYTADPSGTSKVENFDEICQNFMCAEGTAMLLSAPSHAQMSIRALKMDTAVL